jgi:hypothetical protein
MKHIARYRPKILAVVRVFLLVAAVSITGLSAGKKAQRLYDGSPRPADEVATIESSLSRPTFVKIFINGKWVDLHRLAQVLPGTYKISILTTCSAQGGLGLPYYGFVNAPDEFTVSKGDLVSLQVAELQHQYSVTVGKGDKAREAVCFGLGFSHTVTPIEGRQGQP